VFQLELFCLTAVELPWGGLSPRRLTRGAKHGTLRPERALVDLDEIVDPQITFLPELFGEDPFT